MARRRGFTIIEILIVVSILGMLMVALIFGMRGQRSKAEDTRVKSQLERLKIAFEDYYNDNNCYPPTTWFDSSDDCGSGNLKPYLDKIPCNPKSNLPYALEHVGGQCGGFRLYGNLARQSDASAFSPVTVGSGSTTYNYAVSSSNVSANPGGGSTQLPGGHTYYWCSGVNNCTSFDPTLNTCTPHYADDPDCGGTSTNKCSSAGSCIDL